MKLRLMDADRERLGCPDVLDGSLEVFALGEAIALETASGLTWTEAVKLMAPKFTTVPGGRTVEFGPAGLRARIWLGLYRAGIELPYTDIDRVDGSPFFGSSFIADEPEGKATGSPDSEPSTPSTSRTSTRRTRSKTSPK